MPIDGFTLNFIKEDISKLLPARIDRVTLPSKDTLVLFLRSYTNNYKLLLTSNPSLARVHISEQKYENPDQAPMVCMLFRKFIQGSKIKDICQISCDRILKFTIECMTELGDIVDRYLYIEIMGKHSNIILVNEHGKIVDALRRVSSDMSRMRTLMPGVVYELPNTQDKLNPFTMTSDEIINRWQDYSISKFLIDNISGLSKQSAMNLALEYGVSESTSTSTIDKVGFADFLINYYKALKEKYSPILISDEVNFVDFFPFPYKQHENSYYLGRDSLSKAIDEFYSTKDIKDKMKQKSLFLHKHISNMINRCENRLSQINFALYDDSYNDFRIYGEILNANLYSLDSNDKGKEYIVLQNFYDENCSDIKIPLSKELNIKENIQSYFKKYKKGKTSQELAVSQKEQTSEELLSLRQIMQSLEDCRTDSELDQIKMELSIRGYIKSKNIKTKKVEKSIARKYEKDGVQILVGRNGIDNDKLTSQANPDEYWLHVQGVPGSHVIIKSTSPSEDIIEYAAKLAAYFSTAREQTAISVDYTQKKHVKKPAHSAPGYVHYKNFKTMIVSLSESEKQTFAN